MGDKKYLNKEEVRQFLEGLQSLKVRKISHKDLTLMFEALLFGSMRIGEVLQITPESLIGGCKIRLEETKGGWSNCKCSKWKYRPKRLEYSDKDCQKCLGVGRYRIPVEAWIDNQEIYNELVELAKTKKPMQRLFSISRVTAWKYADQLKTRTHAFRHTFLTWMLETEKVDIRDIKQKARHTSLATTDRYIQNNPDLTIHKMKGLIDRV